MRDIMENDADISSLPLLSLPKSTRKLLSDLLNSIKVIQVDKPIKLPRDWRGIASLANISSEVVNSFEQDSDKTTRVISIWCRDQSPTVGQLLEHLQTLDRFDVYDDVIADLTEAKKRGGLRSDSMSSDDIELITTEDGPDHKHQYDAFVLYSDEDEIFVKEMVARLPGFEFCIKDNILPGHLMMHRPIIKLMTERCRYIITVYSPEFLSNKDIEYYRDYAHAHCVKTPTMSIPIMYRKCDLPMHMAHYFMLHVDNCMYDIWEKLAESLNTGRDPPVINPIDRSFPTTITPARALPSATTDTVVLNDSLANVLISDRLDSVEKMIKSKKNFSVLFSSFTKPFKKKKNKYKNEIIMQ